MFVYSWYFVIFFLFFLIWEFLLKFFFLFRRFLIMKTTFSYFPRMFENPAPAVKTNCKLKVIWKKKHYEISTIYECVEKLSIIISCNIRICLIFYDLSWMLQLSEFVWTLRSSEWAVFSQTPPLKFTIDCIKISELHTS